jgi:hypothetical protein
MNTLDDAARAVDEALQALGQASQDLYRCRFGGAEVDAAIRWNKKNNIDGGPLSRELRADAIIIERMRKVIAEFAGDKRQ